jgi:hypothetical protein
MSENEQNIIAAPVEAVAAEQAEPKPEAPQPRFPAWVRHMLRVAERIVGACLVGYIWSIVAEVMLSNPLVGGDPVAWVAMAVVGIAMVTAALMGSFDSPKRRATDKEAGYV